MSDNAQSGTSPSRTKSCCLIGCVGVAFVVVALGIGGGAWIGSFTSGFAEADELRVQRQEIEARGAFVPAAGGRVPAERLEAYLRVRTELLGPCNRFQTFFGAVEQIEEKDRAGDPPDMGEGLSMAMAGFKLPGVMADYFEARNRGLVQEQMSLDEWRWYTVLSYRSAGGAFIPEGIAKERRNISGGAGDRELMRRALDRQLEAARLAGPEVVDADWLAELEAESARLDDPDSQSWPWAEGLPERVTESLRPSAALLVSTYCRHAEDFELDEIERDGMSIRVQ